MRIICVDDEKLILELTVTMCRELPQRPEVTGFQNPDEALAWVGSKGADIALLDINLSGTDGLTLAAKMKEINRNIAIIFLTGYAEFALDAFAIHATGYLMKPINPERLAAEINYAMQIVYANRNHNNTSQIFVRTFGNFEVLVDNVAVHFSRSRSKELLAFFVDKRGNFVTRATAFSALWEDQTYTRPMQKQFDVILRSLRATLEKMATAIPPALDGGLRLTKRKFCFIIAAVGMVQPEFTPVELVGYEDNEAGSPLALDNG